MKKMFIFTMGFYLMLTAFARSVSAVEKTAESSGKIARRLLLKTDDRRKLAMPKLTQARVRKLQFFLKKHNSPLSAQALNFVLAARMYSLDWRLLAAISGVESGFGKQIPQNSYNAWGFGIPTGKQSGLAFKSWKEGIEIVSKNLKEKYLDRGADNLFKIGRIYAPPSKTWPSKVAYFMKKIEETSPSPGLSL